MTDNPIVSHPGGDLAQVPPSELLKVMNIIGPQMAQLARIEQEIRWLREDLSALLKTTQGCGQDIPPRLHLHYDLPSEGVADDVSGIEWYR